MRDICYTHFLAAILSCLFLLNANAQDCITFNEMSVNAIGDCDGCSDSSCGTSGTDCSAGTAEYTEFYNNCGYDIDIGCYLICDPGWCLTIQPGTVIPANGYIVFGSPNSPGLTPNSNLYDMGNYDAGNGVSGPNPNDFMVFTNGSPDQVGLFDDSGSFLAGAYWNGGNGTATFGVSNFFGCGSQTISFPNSNSSDSDFINLGTAAGNVIGYPCNDNTQTLTTFNPGTPGFSNIPNAIIIEEVLITGCLYTGVDLDFEIILDPSSNPISNSAISWTISGGNPSNSIGNDFFNDVNFAAAGNYTVVIEDEGSPCTFDQYSQDFTIATGVEVDITADLLSVCGATDVTFSANNNLGNSSGSYILYNEFGSPLSPPYPFNTNGIFTYNTTGNESFYVSYFDDNFCEFQSDLITISSNGANVAFSNPNPNACPGDTVLLVFNGIPGFVFTWGIPPSELGDPTNGAYEANVVPASLPSTYTVSGTDNNGCPFNISATVTLGGGNVVADFTIPSPICQGQPFTVTNLSTNATSYAWTFNGAEVETFSSFEPTITYNGSGSQVSAELIISGCGGSSPPHYEQITVEQVPFLLVENSTVCDPNAQIQLSATINLPPLGYTFNWSGSNFLDDTTLQSPTIINPLTQPTLFTVEVCNGAGCCQEGNILVSASGLPQYTFDINSTCANEEVVVTGISSNGNSLLFNWVNNVADGLPFGAIVQDNESVTFTPNNNNPQFFMTIIDQNTTCNADTILTINLDNSPNASINGVGTMCFPDNISLTATGGATYEWLSPTEVDNVFNNTTNWTPIVTSGVASIEVVALSTSGCADTAIHLIQVSEAPSISFSSANATICEGDSVDISILGNAFYYTVTPSNSDFISLNDNDYVFFPNATTTYDVSANINGCASTEQLTITVSTNGVIQINGPTNPCEGDTIELTAIGMTNVTWDPHFSIISDLNQPTIQVVTLQSETYTVNSNGGGTCASTGTFTTQPIEVDVTFQLDQDTVNICNGNSAFVLVDGSGQLASYTSNFPATINEPSGLNGFMEFFPTTTTNYVVTANAPSGNCPATDEILIIVNEPAILDYTVDDLTLCPTETATLDVNPLFTNVFVADANGGTNSVTSISVNSWSLNPQVNTTYQIIAEDMNGCEVTAGFTIESNLTNDILANNQNPTICTGEIFNLIIDNTNLTSVTFPTDATLTVINGFEAGLQPLVNQTYTINAIDNLGCADVLNVNVSVQANASLNLQPFVSVCAGNEINISVSGGGLNYTWTPANPNLNTIGNGSSAIYNASNTPQNLTFIINSNLSGSCTALDSIEIEVLPLPIVTLSESLLEMCGDVATTVTVNGANNISFNGAGLSAGNIDTEINVNPILTNPSTIYTITGFNNVGCFDSTYLTVNILDDIGFNFLTESLTICEGYTLDIAVSGGGNEYNWTPNISNSPLGTTAQISPSATATYFVTSEMTDYCIFEDSITIEVEEIPTISFDDDDITICENGSAIVNVNINGGYLPSGALTWISPDIVFGANNNQIIVSPSFATGSQTYDVSYQSDYGCNSAIAQLTVSIATELPINVIAISNTICEGETLTLEFQGANNFAYSPTINTTAITNSIIEVSPDITTVFTIDGNSGTCLGSTTYTVNVNPNPALTIDVPSPAFICNDSSQIINLTAGLTYTFSQNNTVTTLSSTQFELNPTTSTNYTITGEDANGCNTAIQFQLDVDPFNAINLSLSDDNICIGENSIITAQNGNTFVWDIDATLSNLNSANTTANPIVTTNYSVTASSNLGCSLTESITLNVAPQIQPIVLGDQFICENTEVILFASGGAFYEWSPNIALSNPNIATPIATPTNNITYTVIITDIFGCEETETVDISIVNSPVLTVDPINSVCVGDTFYFNFSAQNFNSIVWSGGNGSFGDINTLNTYYALAANETAGNVNLNVDLTSDCGNLSESVVLSITPDLLSTNAGEDAFVCVGLIAYLPEINSINNINWTTANGIGDLSTFTYEPAINEIGEITLIMEESNACSAVYDSIILEIIPVEPIIITTTQNVNIDEGQFITVFVEGGNQYLWTSAAAVGCGLQDDTPLIYCEEVDLFPTTTTTFYVSDPTNECRTDGSITVYVDEFESGYLYLPTAITPNGDGKNDFFEVTSYKIDEYLLQIFNRYGEMVFNTTDVNEKWNGYYLEEEQELSTFVWQVRYNFTYDDRIKTEGGNVTVIH